MADYYVMKTGNDTTGDGSEANPWLTLRKGFTELQDGDLLLVGDGTYSQSISLDGRQFGADYVTVQAINPRKVVISGSGCGWSTRTVPCHYVKFVGLVFTANAFVRCTGSQEWHSHLWFEDCEWYGTNYGLQFYNAEYLTIRGCYYHHNAVPMVFGYSGQSYCRHVLIEDTELAYNASGTSKIDGLTFERNKYDPQEQCDLTFRRVVSHHNYDSGFDVKPGGGIWEGCQAYDNRGSGFKTWSDYHTFYNCLAHHNFMGWEPETNHLALNHCTAWANWAAIRADMTAPPTLTIRNSILGTAGGYIAVAKVIYSDRGPGAPLLDRNCYYCDRDDDLLYQEYQGPTYPWSERASWATQGAHSVCADPLLNLDYLPTAGSPALGLADDGLNAGWLGPDANAPVPPALPKLHVVDTAASLVLNVSVAAEVSAAPPLSSMISGYHAEARVRVSDELGQPVEGASVAATWSGLTSQRMAAPTGPDGVAVLRSAASPATAGTFTATVTGASKGAWAYDPAANGPLAAAVAIEDYATVAAGLLKRIEAALVEPVPPVTPQMHVAGIAMVIIKDGARYSATATITVVDAAGVFMPGAVVSGVWSGLTADSDSRATLADGTVTVQSNTTKRTHGTFTFTVTAVAKDGMQYDPAANVATSGSIVLG